MTESVGDMLASKADTVSVTTRGKACVPGFGQSFAVTAQPSSSR